MTSPPRLAQYVQPDLPESRIASQWARITAREADARPGWAAKLAWSGATVGLMTATAVVVWGLRPTPTPAGPGIAFESRSSVDRLSLPDGVGAELGPETRLSIAGLSGQAISLSLERGSAKFEVTPRPGRTVSVVAAGFEVVVVGTRFTVALGNPPEQPRMHVSVEQGKVTIHRQGVPKEVRTLSAGEAWSDGAVAVDRPEPSPSIFEQPPSSSAAPSETVNEPEPPPASRRPSARAVGSPKELFEAAETARLEGRPREAAAALDRLRRRYRGDSRAALAAFELGRLRMDTLGDPAGAAEALTDALALGLGSSFRQDAELRLVQAYHRLGNLDRCQRAKADFLAHYAGTANRKVIDRLCTR